MRDIWWESIDWIKGAGEEEKWVEDEIQNEAEAESIFRNEVTVNPRPIKVDAIRMMKTKESRNPAAPESFMPMARPARRITMLCIMALVMPTDDLPRMMLSRLIGVTIISFKKPFSRCLLYTSDAADE